MHATRFETDAGRPVPAVTTEEMRAVDRVAVEEVGYGLLSMMEHAGRNLAGNVRELVGSGGQIVVLAGSGGNGGGGLCAARHLLNHGYTVDVVLGRDPGDLQGAAATQYGVLDAMGVELAGTEAIPAAALVVDALVGYGLSGPLRGRSADVASACERGTDRVLSLDVPSGIDATTGAAPGAAVTPDRTLTLALPKVGLADVPGDLVLGDIGIPATVYDRLDIDYRPPFDGEYCRRIDVVD